jgi:2'-5' RNA ligase
MANCILLSLPKELEDSVKSWAAEHIDGQDVYGKDGKGFEHSPHITAAHGIDDEDIHGAVSKIMDNAAPIKVKLGLVEFFIDPEKDYHVLKISVEPGAAEEFHESVVDSVSMYNPTYEYHPHITLAYLKPGACQELYGNQDFLGQEVEISSCLLMTNDAEPKRLNFGGMHGVDKEKQ